MSNLYNLFPSSGGYQFTNHVGDQYYVYLTAYSLLNPDGQDEASYVDVYMIGFSCKRANPKHRKLYDAKSKDTIMFIFRSFMELHPDDAFLYVCDNRDGLARNRRVTFGRWFHEENSAYEQHHSPVSYGQNNWYSAILIKKENADKQLFINAYHYTLRQMISDIDEVG